MERLQLSNGTFEGDNNAYLFEGSETVLVDTGDWTTSTRDQLETALSTHGVPFEEIDYVLLTHWHPDHAGLAGEIQAVSGATVFVHENDLGLVEGDESAWEEMLALQDHFFEAWRIPETKRTALRDHLTGPETGGRAPNTEPFSDGERFEFDAVEFEAVHAPGHTDGLCLFEFDSGREVLTGDALLPEYTPNVGGADIRVERPLEKYLRSLRMITESSYARAWPGHRDPISNPTGRANAIIRHHETRAWRVLEVLRRRGASSVWEVSAELFGELKGIHIIHGPGESYAHLEHLEAEGTVERSETEFMISEEAREKLENRSDERWPLFQ
jgi:glyoxylase-like metal-dependent hydrolase (beta-lactamase superfamily II)